MVFCPETIALAASIMGGIEADWAWVYHDNNDCTNPQIVDVRRVSTPARFPIDWPYLFQQHKPAGNITKTAHISYSHQSMLDNTSRGLTLRPQYIRQQVVSHCPAFVGLHESRGDALQRRIGPFLAFSNADIKGALG